MEYTPQAYQQFVRNCLSRQEQPVRLALVEICRQLPGCPGARLNIEIAPRGILSGLPVRFFYSDEHGRALPGRPVSLEEAFGNILTPAETEAIYRFDEIGVETIEIELQTLLEWLMVCWQSIPKPEKMRAAYLSIENDRDVLDLFQMRWIPNPLHKIQP